MRVTFGMLVLRRLLWALHVEGLKPAVLLRRRDRVYRNRVCEADHKKNSYV
jgi:hypothetical protein